MPFFSVIIPTYNRYESLKKAIDFLLIHQTFRDFELIVVDDGSTDETHQIEDEYRDQLVYIKQKNYGVSKARNVGIANSNSPYISFHDSDDLWYPRKLENQYMYILNNPDFLINQTDEIWIRDGVRVNPMKKHRKREGDIFLDSLELCLISPSCVAMTRELFERYGLFDENLPVCEDYDLWLRITLKERVGLIDKKLVIKYGGHESQLSKKYWGMDRFRVYSIIKLLIHHGNEINPEYQDRAIEVAKKKCAILLQGALRRQNDVFADTIKKIIECIDNYNYNRISLENLLKI